MFGRVTKRDLLHALERERRQHRDEVRELLDRVAALAGNPWTLPPRPVEPRDQPKDEIAETYGPLEEL